MSADVFAVTSYTSCKVYGIAYSSYGHEVNFKKIRSKSWWFARRNEMLLS